MEDNPTRSLHFRDSIEVLAERNARHDDTGPGYQTAVARDITSQHYRNVHFPTFESGVRTCLGDYSHLGATNPIPQKHDCNVYTAGKLSDADHDSPRVQGNVERFDTLIYDFDKGYETEESLIVKCTAHGVLAGAGPSYNDGMTSHKLPWATTQQCRKTGKETRKPGKFQKFCNGRTPNDELARAFAIEVEGYSPLAMSGAVLVGSPVIVSSRRVTTEYVILAHGSVAKVRLIISLKKPFKRKTNESTKDFIARYIAFYHAVARMLGLTNYDRSCDTIERAYYGFASNPNRTETARAVFSQGKPLSLNDPALLIELARTEPNEKQISKSVARPKKTPLEFLRSLNRSEETGGLAHGFRGFLAADAAADLWDDVTDKRDSSGLVAIECPFIDEHTTSNQPGVRQLAVYNARSRNTLPVCKCFSDTCKDRPYGEFLNALFAEDVMKIKKYRG